MIMKDNQKTERHSGRLKYGWSKVNEMAKSFNQERTEHAPKAVGLVKQPAKEDEHKDEREDRE